MKKILISTSLTVAVLLVFSQNAWAHILKTNGSIGAVLHIDPDDDPIAGQVSTFFLDFKDTTGKFQLEKCSCEFSIFRSGQKIATQPLSQNNTFIFPQKDIYQVQVSGVPLQAGQFQPFKLNYDIRVERAVVSPQPTSTFLTAHAIHLIGAVAWAVVVLGMIIKERLSKT